jgi:phosphoribosylformylglycinamidine synthase subunit PurS
MTARVFVTLKKTVLDPQGQAIRRALNAHGHPAITEVRQGKYFEIELTASEKTEAEAELKRIAGDVLANPVIEEYRIELVG